jgi:hypothetical protein
MLALNHHEISFKRGELSVASVSSLSEIGFMLSVVQEDLLCFFGLDG